MSYERRVLMISPTPTHPANAGNRVRIAAILKSLDALGLDFHFAHFRTEQAMMRPCARAGGRNDAPFGNIRLCQTGRRFGAEFTAGCAECSAFHIMALYGLTRLRVRNWSAKF